MSNTTKKKKKLKNPLEFAIKCLQIEITMAELIPNGTRISPSNFYF